MKARLLALTTSAMVASALLPMTAQADLSGNVGVVSQYILRGITNAPEDDKAAIQGGFDWSDPSGFYAGYWGSNLGYNSPQYYSGQGFENDYYGGYAGSAGDLSYKVGLIGYYYVNVANANSGEFDVSVGYGGVTLDAKTLVSDASWGNKGDTYVSLSYGLDLPQGFSLSALAGYYFYEDNGKFIASSKESSAFRNLDITLSHPIGDTGADMNLTYIVGGKDRDGKAQDNAVTIGVSYGFDIK